MPGSEPPNGQNRLIVAIVLVSAAVLAFGAGLFAVSIQSSRTGSDVGAGQTSVTKPTTEPESTEPETTESETTESEPTTHPETTEAEPTTEPETTESEPTTHPETTEAEPTTEPETTDAPGGEGMAVFGETVTYDDGLSVTVDGPEEFQPSETAAFEEAPSYVRFTVTVANDTPDPFDPGLFYIVGQSGQAEASEVFDTDQGLEGSPLTTVLSGREVSWDVGFSVEDPDDVVLEVSPSWDHESTIFVSGLRSGSELRFPRPLHQRDPLCSNGI